jgi:hypothetical protein
MIGGDSSVSALVEQLPTLIGVALGALGSYLTNAAFERTRWRRDREARWDERRLTAYADYATALKATIATCARVAAGAGAGDAFTPRPYPLDLAAAMPELAREDIDRSEAWEAVLMLGVQPVISAGRSWSGTVEAMEHFVRHQQHDVAAWRNALAASGHARQVYYHEVRLDLQIRAGRLTVAGETGCAN